MGLIRKATSISTLGLVSYRTSGERAARYARQTRNAARLNNIQNMQMIELQRQQLEAETQAQVMRATQVAATQLQAPRQAPPALPWASRACLRFAMLGPSTGTTRSMTDWARSASARSPAASASRSRAQALGQAPLTPETVP